MPTNVTPDYRRAEDAYRQAKTTDEKIERLEEMISLLPKHKGTDHLYADLKRRLSKLRSRSDSSGKHGSRGSHVELTGEGAAHGAARVLLIGPPNSGKSTILRAISHAHPEVADYPFTTTQMLPGMVPFEDIQIQLIDTPAVTADHMPADLLGFVRAVHATVIVADLSSDTVLDDMNMVIEVFADRHVTFSREASPEDHDVVLATILANKADAPGAEDSLGLLRDMIADRLELWPVIATDADSVGELPRMLFEWLRVVRVYTKAPGKKPDHTHPFAVFEGQTVLDVCKLVHRDFYDNLKFARLWRGDSPPKTVSRDEPVRDGDILELHV